MRRKDREVTGIENILAILEKCEFLHLGLCADNKPYIVPMNFGYENLNGKLVVYLHGAKEGKKHDMIAKNNNVCFEAACEHETIKSEEPCKFTTTYQSVIGEGIISIAENDTDKIKGLDCLMKHYGFKGKPEYSSQSLAAVEVLKIEVSSITGKHHIK